MIEEYLKLHREVWLYFFVCILFSMGSAIIPFLILLLTSEFHFSTSQSGLLFCIIMLLLIPASLTGGRIANRYNKKNTIIIMRFLYAVCLLLYIQTHILIIKLVLLVMALIFLGISNPSLNSIVLDMVPEGQSRKAYSLIYVGQNLGSIIAPLITGVLFNKIQLLFTFYGLSAISACVIIMLFISYDFDGIKHSKYNKENNPSSLISTEKMLFWKNPIAICMLLSFIGFEFCYAQQSFSLPIGMQNIFKNLGTKYYGYVVSYNSILILILTPVITLFTKKISPINSIIISGAFCGIGFGMLNYASLMSSIIILVTSWTIGEVLYSINSFIAFSKLFKKGEAGTASALILVSRSIGISFCSMFSSLIIQIEKISIVWIITFIMSMLSAVLLSFAKRKLTENALV